MTTLTEQWKKGELPNGIYYVELLGGNTMIAYMYKVHPYKNKTVYRVKAFNGFITKYQMKAVLSEVPTYEEWKAQQNYEEHQKKCISIYENKEKQHTDDAIAYNELAEENTKLKTENKWYSEQLNEAVKKIDKLKEQKKPTSDCKTIAQKLLQVKPELREWLEVNYKEYL